MYRGMVIGPDPNKIAFTFKVHGNHLKKGNVGTRVVGRKVIISKPDAPDSYINSSSSINSVMRENHNNEVINKGQPNPLAIADKKSQPDLSDKIQKEVKKKKN